MLRFNIPVNVPAAAMAPDGQMKPPDMLLQWERLRSHLGRFLPHATEASACYPVFRYPVAAMLDTFQVTTLAGRHLIQHERQVKWLPGVIGQLPLLPKMPAIAH